MIGCCCAFIAFFKWLNFLLKWQQPLVGPLSIVMFSLALGCFVSLCDLLLVLELLQNLILLQCLQVTSFLNNLGFFKCNF